MANIEDIPGTPVTDIDGAAWAKFAAIILWKLNRQTPVTVTNDDLKKINADFEAEGLNMAVIANQGSITFHLVKSQKYVKMAAEQAVKKSREGESDAQGTEGVRSS